MSDYYLGRTNKKLTEKLLDDDYEVTRQDFYECDSISLSDSQARTIMTSFESMPVHVNTAVTRKFDEILEESDNKDKIVDFVKHSPAVFLFDKSMTDNFIQKMRNKVDDFVKKHKLFDS